MQPVEATQRVAYLGFYIDTVNFTVTAPKDKLDAIRDMTLGLSETSRWTVKRWAALRGKIVSLRPAFGTRCLVTSRPMAIEVDAHAKRHGWGNRLYMKATPEIMVGINLLLQHLDDWNQKVIATPHNAIKLSQVLAGDNHLLEDRVIENQPLS